MPTCNINLTDHLDRFVQKEIKAGRYRNASEVMRAGLRLLEQQTHEDQEKLALLRSLATEAFQELDDGKGAQISGDRELDDFTSSVRRRVASIEKRR